VSRTPSGANPPERASEPVAAIAPGRAVALHLEVRFQDGFVALSTFDDAPIACTIGDGTLTAALETTLLGLAPGSETYVVAHGSELFSPYDEANIHWLELSDFPPDIAPEPGLVVAFTTPGGHETAGMILELDADRVRVDFNHPFAGRSLTIRVRILSVTEPRPTTNLDGRA
jgi:FKBP-type peptidyl-prolyl cis-trans isomerase SlpA